MEAQHTPGPWKCSDKPKSLSANVHKHGQMIAMVHGNDNYMANARLIAAAPDLLEALERLLDFVVRASKDYDATSVAEAAIAKAKQ